MKEESRSSVRGSHATRGAIDFKSALGTCIATLLVLSLALAIFKGHEHRHPTPAVVARHLVNRIVYRGDFRATEALKPFGSNAIPSLREALQLKTSHTRDGYVIVRAKLPLTLRRYLPELLSTDKVRANAATLAGLLGPVASPAIPDLINLLEDSTADSNAAVSLGMMGPDAQRAIPALTVAVLQHRYFWQLNRVPPSD